uniref:Annexin n=1 Tax=Plectus sambesii TaxID=2011161 RepID=A0A914WD51_9BILA
MSTKRAKSKDDGKAVTKRAGSKPRKSPKPPNDPHPKTAAADTPVPPPPKTATLEGAVSPQPPEIGINFEDLLNDLEDELGGHFLDLTLALLCPSHLYDAHIINKAISGVGTDEHALIEVLCTRSNSELELIKEAYHTEFRRNLEKDISNEVSGDFGRLMRSVVTATRDENKELDSKLAETDAQKLTAGGVGKLGTDEVLFNHIFCLRSWPQLKATFEAYRRKNDIDIELDIRKEFHGEIRDALLTIVKVAKNMQSYFAEKLNEAMKGAGTDDEALIRVIVSRSEVVVNNFTFV